MSLALVNGELAYAAICAVLTALVLESYRRDKRRVG